MYCIKCGKQLPDVSAFCAYCGEKQIVTQEFSNDRGEEEIEHMGEASEPRLYTHPYHRMGGWLTFFTYVPVAFLIVLDFLIVLVGIPLIVELLSRNTFSSDTQFQLIVAVVGFGLASVFGWKTFIGLLRGSFSFLKNFELFSILFIVTCCVMHFRFAQFEGLGNGVAILLALIIISIIWMVYFLKSVRVRTYFTSDEYLRRSIFFKWVKSPIPADTQPYTSKKDQQPILTTKKRHSRMVIVLVAAVVLIGAGVWFFILRTTPDEKVAQIYLNAILSNDVKAMIENTFGGESLIDHAVRRGRATSRRDAIRQIKDELGDGFANINTLEIIGKSVVSGEEHLRVYQGLDDFEYFRYNDRFANASMEELFSSGSPLVQTIYRFDIEANVYSSGYRTTITTQLYVASFRGGTCFVIHYGDLKF